MSKKEFYIVYIYFEKVMFNLSIVDYKFIKDSIMLKYKMCPKFYRDIKQSSVSI